MISRVADIYTGDMNSIMTKAIEAYEIGHFDNLYIYPKMFAGEAIIVMAYNIDESIKDIAVERGNLTYITERVTSTLDNSPAIYRSIEREFKIALCNEIVFKEKEMEIDRLYYSNSGGESLFDAIEYNISVIGKEIDEVEDRFKMKYIKDIITILNMFGLGLDDYNDWKERNIIT